MNDKQRRHNRSAFVLLIAVVILLSLCNTFSMPYVIQADPPAQIEGEWIQSSNGKWWYRHTDGSYTTDGWEYINGRWYHFDSSGWMQTGWLRVNAKWYYLGTNGAMVTGWRAIDGYWYYFNSSGDMRTADLYSSLRHYQFYSNGRLRSTVILITRQQQEKSNWCWAASAVMAGTYHTTAYKTQSGAVQFAKGTTEDVKGTITDTIQALFYASDYTKNGYSLGVLSYTTAASQIDANQMFLMRIKWDGGGGHIVVGAGYDHLNSSIYVIDPWDHCISQFYDYDDLVTGTTIQSGTGRWNRTIIY